MEHATCNIIYVDHKARRDEWFRGGARILEQNGTDRGSPSTTQNLKLLLEVFGEGLSKWYRYLDERMPLTGSTLVYVCCTGGSCLNQWLDLQDASVVELKPTMILIDTPFQDQLAEREPSRSASPHDCSDEGSGGHEEDLYGLALLQRIVSEAQIRNLSRLVVPVTLVAFPECKERGQSDDDFREIDETGDHLANGMLHSGATTVDRMANRRMLKKCLDFGAVDVMENPMNGKSGTNLEVHAYRAHREAARDQKALTEVRRGRKRSWVGISEEKPFAYLREAMVSNLMGGICLIDEEEDEVLGAVRLSVTADRFKEVASAVGQWHFDAHSFTDDELVIAASLMFQHALTMPALEPWRIPTDQMHSFVVACRAAYNTFVPYHNFRHVVDVLQATFNFLVEIGALPSYSTRTDDSAHPSWISDKSPVAILLNPFEALTLLITAIGHDVGHPGVNNGFLVTLNAPLAQLYNDRSVLESFHCAAYSQILRRYWPAAFNDSKMRNLMISSILATDMGLHFDYMKKMGDLQDKLHTENTTDGWNGRMVDEQKALACALLIKCADISNVARKHDTAVQWMHILSDEFSRQSSMESELAIPTSLMAQPKKDIISLVRAQLSFMNLFAIPLFQGVADILPAMQYCVDELDANKRTFEQSVAAARTPEGPDGRILQRDGTFSPRTMSFIVGPEARKEANNARGSASGSDIPTERDFIVQESGAAGKAPSNIDQDSPLSGPFTVIRGKLQEPSKQRCSETTEGSSAPYSGDWASQATSATTGRMPLSPSTQGTSIISSDSMDRPDSIPVTTITAPKSSDHVPYTGESPATRTDLKKQRGDERQLPNGHLNDTSRSLEVEYEGKKLLKKKSSRFRIKDAIPFFRRHLKAPSPPMHAADNG